MDTNEKISMYLFKTDAGIVAIFASDIEFAWGSIREWCKNNTPGSGALLMKGAGVRNGRAVYVCK